MLYASVECVRITSGALVALLLFCSPARAADVVAHWNTLALKTVLMSEPQPARAAYAMATVHLAMFETINFIEGGYPPRLITSPAAPLGGAGDAAAAASAHHVLGEMYPQRRAALDKALERSLAAVPDAQERTNARIWGRQLGGIVYATRRADGAASPAPAAVPVAALNTMVAAYIEARGFKPIDGARVHALASTAMADACAAKRDASTAVLTALHRDLTHRSHP